MVDLKVYKHSADDILQLIFDSPYMTEFMEGILPKEKFLFFKLQDILYLNEFAKGLFLISQQVLEYREKFVNWSKGIEQELHLLQVRFKTELKDAEPSRSNLLYTSYLMKCIAEGKPYKSLSAFYPCYWIYYKVGRYLYKYSKEFPNNPYHEWIEFYYSEDFATAVKDYKSILFKTLAQCNESEFNDAMESFRLGCQMEYLFWDSAYHYEKWPIQKNIPIKNQPLCSLTIAGSDSSGGAGVQADMNTFLAHQIVGSSVITAVTAQNSIGVHDIFPIPSEKVKSQLIAVLDDYEIKSIKIGMIFEMSIVDVLYDVLSKQTNIKIVIDPVMISTSGHKLIKEESNEKMFKKLFSLSYLITPNIPEALALLNSISDNNEIKELLNTEEMEKAVRKIAEYFSLNAILLKGGHKEIEKKSIDILYIRSIDKIHIFEKSYLDPKNTHGTGCSLSSAIAANLAKGYSLPSAVKCAKAYVHNAISKGFRLGKGEHGTLCHF